MKKRHTLRTIVASTTVSAAVFTSILFPLTARGAEESKHEGHAGKMPTSMAQLMKMSPEECMKMMDKEHTGHVTKKEFMNFQEQLWKQMDKNHDGRVDTAEFTDAG